VIRKVTRSVPEIVQDKMCGKSCRYPTKEGFQRRLDMPYQMAYHSDDRPDSCACEILHRYPPPFQQRNDMFVCYTSMGGGGVTPCIAEPLAEEAV
jgi:hypothetical protein